MSFYYSGIYRNWRLDQIFCYPCAELDIFIWILRILVLVFSHTGWCGGDYVVDDLF